MKKLNKKQKEHIKNILKKTLNIFCYICTGILAIILLVASLQGCQNRPQKVSAESYNIYNRYSYYLRFDTEVVEDFEHINDQLLSAVNLPTGDLTGEVEVLTYKDFYYDLSIGTQLYTNNNDYVFIKHLKLTYFTLSDGDDDGCYWRLKSMLIYTDDENDGYDILHKSGSSAYNSDYYAYYIGEYYLIYSDLNFYSIPTISVLFEGNELSQFTFNKDFNYNAPLGTNINGLYGTAVFDGGSSVIKYLNYDVGYFYSNGQLFNRIQYSCTTSDGIYAVVRSSTNSSGTINQLPVGYWVYQFMYYVNTDTNTYILVNTHNSEPFTQAGSSGISRYLTNDTTWEIDDYRNLYFINSLSEANKNTLNKFNNNNQSGTSGYVVSGDVNNIFTLIASAFTGLLPILTTYILPGITIGTLLFIPLVALLVFAIIRIIKK